MNDNRIKPNVIVIGGHFDDGLLAIKIAEMKLQNQNIEVVTLDEAKERGIIIIDSISEYKAPKPLPELIEPKLSTILTIGLPGHGKSSRNKRREAERKAKKGYKY